MAPPETTDLFEYASKTVSVAAPTRPDFVIGGTLNIRNPGVFSARISKQLVVPGAGTSKVFTEDLEPGAATRITSQQVSDDFGLTFTDGVEGFLVIQCPTSLDVVTVYTAGPRGGPATVIDVVHVPERRLAASASSPAPGVTFEYASKTVSVAAPTRPDFVIGGTLNIRNPGVFSARISKQLVVPGAGPSKVFTEDLEPGAATRITSRQVAESFGTTFTGEVEGFLVVRSPTSLDVVALYTAGPRGGPVTAIDVVHVPERRLVEKPS